MKKAGWTTPETIITLLIIGIVMIILIPNLLKNTNTSQFKTAYKKVLSSFKHQITMNVAIDDFDFRVIHNSATPEDQANKRSFASIITNRFEGSEDITEVYFNKENGNDGEQVMTIIGDHRCTEADMKNGAKNYKACSEAGGVGRFIENVKNTYKISGKDFIVYQLPDGTAVGYNKNAKECIESVQENCVGFIDVNGVKGPNKLTVCDSEGDWETSCVVSRENIVDIYPVVFYNQSFEPATVAGKSILYGLKENK